MRADVRDPAAAAWSATPTTASPARRPSSTRGSATARPGSGRASASASRAGSGCRSAGRGSSPTATCPPASRSCASSSTASASSSASSAAARDVFWNPDVFGYNGQLPQIMRGAGHRRLPHAEALVEPLQRRPSTTPSAGSGSTARPCSRTSRRPTPTTPRRPSPSCAARRATSRTTRCRRAACSSSAGATAAAGRRREMLETLARVEDLQDVPRTTIGDPEAFFAALADEARVARGRRRALPRVPPRHLHDAGAHQAREPARGAGAARRRAARAPSARRAVAARGARRRLADAPAQPLPRHPPGLVDRRGPRARRARPGRGRGGGRRGARPAALRRRGRQHDRRRRAARSSRRAAACAFAEAPPCGVGRLVDARGDGARRARTGDGFVLENEHLRAVARPRRHAALARRAGERPRGDGRARQRARALRGPPDRLRGLGPRPVPPRDPQRLPAGHDAPRSSLAGPAARRGRLRAPDRRAQPHAPDRAPRRRVPRGSSSTARSTGTRTAAR